MFEDAAKLERLERELGGLGRSVEIGGVDPFFVGDPEERTVDAGRDSCADPGRDRDGRFGGLSTFSGDDCGIVAATFQ